jgi:hypothetical protein
VKGTVMLWSGLKPDDSTRRSGTPSATPNAN